MDHYNYATIVKKNLRDDEKMVNVGIKKNLDTKTLDRLEIQDTDGMFFKGCSDDFSPLIPFFHLYQDTEKSREKGAKIYLDNVKLIYFMRSTEDDSFEKSEKRIPPPGPTIEVTCKDGEVLQGIMIDSRPNGFGFFLLTNQNNITKRVFVVDTAIKKIRGLK